MLFASARFNKKKLEIFSRPHARSQKKNPKIASRRPLPLMMKQQPMPHPAWRRLGPAQPTETACSSLARGAGLLNGRRWLAARMAGFENLGGEPPFFVHDFDVVLKPRDTQSYTASLPISNLKADSDCSLDVDVEPKTPFLTSLPSSELFWSAQESLHP
jgi:hypothetical protein